MFWIILLNIIFSLFLFASNHTPYESSESQDTSSFRQEYSLDFDGIDDYVMIPDNDILDLNLTDLTVEAWIFPRCESSDLLHSFIRKMDGNRNGYNVSTSQF